MLWESLVQQQEVRHKMRKKLRDDKHDVQQALGSHHRCSLRASCYLWDSFTTQLDTALVKNMPEGSQESLAR